MSKDVIKHKKAKLSTCWKLFLCVAVAVYSLSAVFTKLASLCSFLSIPFFIYLCGVIIVLGSYAVLWQIALKKIPLNLAYPFRSLSVIYGLAIAFFLFHENVTWQNLLGGLIVLFGLLIINTGK